MSLDLPTEQRLQSVGLVTFFNNHKREWAANVQDCYDHVKKAFPADSVIRPDDVRKILLPAVEVHPDLKAELDRKKLTQKYWFGHFTDLAIERTWTGLKK